MRPERLLLPFGQVISIHAPQWGATTGLAVYLTVQGISIHAPQWGATDFPGRPQFPYGFQSTHPSGVRRDDVRDADAQVVISIHAPQWGATVSDAARADYYTFQSTHPSGVRREATARTLRTGDISIHAPQWGATSKKKNKTKQR